MYSYTMTIDELKIFLNNACLGISEHMERLIFILHHQIPENMQFGDIVFLFIFGLLTLSIFLSAFTTVRVNKKVGLESYYLDKISVQLKKDNEK